MFAAVFTSLFLAALVSVVFAGGSNLVFFVAFVVFMAAQGVLALYTDWYI